MVSFSLKVLASQLATVLSSPRDSTFLSIGPPTPLQEQMYSTLQLSVVVYPYVAA